MKVFYPLNSTLYRVKVQGEFKFLPSGPFIDSDGMEDVLNKETPGAFRSEIASYKLPKGHDLTDKSLLITRRGGYGDLLWITRIIRKLKQKYPSCKVSVASHPRHHLVFKNNSDVQKLYEYPFRKADFDSTNYQLTFENVIEPIREPISVYDLFASQAGIELDPNEKIPVYKISKDMQIGARDFLRKLNINRAKHKTIMIHMGSSTPWKSWNPEKSLSLAATLGEAGIKVFMVGNMKDFPFLTKPIRNVYNLCRRGNQDFWPIEYTIALMTKMDLFIGPDSGLIHFSAALNIPSIAIYGPFPAKGYVSTYPLCTPVDPDAGVCPYMPCYPHLDNVCTNRDSHGFGKCLNSMPVEKIIPIIERKLDVNLKNKPVKILVVENQGGILSPERNENVGSRDGCVG